MFVVCSSLQDSVVVFTFSIDINANLLDEDLYTLQVALVGSPQVWVDLAFVDHGCWVKLVSWISNSIGSNQSSQHIVSEVHTGLSIQV